MSYLQPYEVDYYAPNATEPHDLARIYPELLTRARDTADRAALLSRQNAQLHNEVDRLAGQVRPMHKCSRCGGHDHCPKQSPS